MGQQNSIWDRRCINPIPLTQDLETPNIILESTCYRHLPKYLQESETSEITVCPSPHISFDKRKIRRRVLSEPKYIFFGRVKLREIVVRQLSSQRHSKGEVRQVQAQTTLEPSAPPDNILSGMQEALRDV